MQSSFSFIYRLLLRSNKNIFVESSESEESSSSSDEEEEGSVDSRDIGPIRLDPNVCPEGCDKDIYDKTFEMRNNRWDIEKELGLFIYFLVVEYIEQLRPSTCNQ